jgi:biopolymer transport protein ExbB
MLVWRRCRRVLVFMLLGVVLGTTALMAGEPTTPPSSDSSMLRDMFSGGTFGNMIMASLFMLSALALALVIEDFWSIRRELLIPQTLAQDVDALLAAGEYNEAIELVDGEESFLGKVIHAGLADMRSGYDAMFESMQAAGEIETTKLHRKIEYLSLVGSIAPMDGLFGTVWGMILAFKRIATVRNPAPSDLAGAIYTALYTTLVGLIIAMPVMVVYTFFQNRIIHISMEVGGIAEELIRRFKPREE